MKKMRKIALPLAILLIGAGSAYATNLASDTKAVEMVGWRFNPENPSLPCADTTQFCTTINTGATCTVSDLSGIHNLYDEGCEVELYKIP